jgi:hypothetical protein
VSVHRLAVFALLAVFAGSAVADLITTIDVPGATETEPDGINNSGQIVGSYIGSSNTTN